MTIPRVFVTRILPEKGMQLIHQVCEAEVWPDELPPPYEILLEKARGAACLVSLLTDRIDAGLMDAAGGTLKVISQMAVGYDNVDVVAATARGIPVGNTPGVLTEATADFAFTLLMAAARRVVEGERYVMAGAWKTWGPTLLMGYDVHGATLGLVGFGRIGQAMARRAGGLGMRILYHDLAADPGPAQQLGAQSRSLEGLLAESDFVSLHVPLTPETQYLIGERQLRKMKPSAILINTSRGPVVDPLALYDALRQRTIAAAALDVTDPEPIQLDDPLLSLENCLIVPHIASSNHATRTRMATMTADNLSAGLRGERLPNCVNPEVYR